MPRNWEGLKLGVVALGLLVGGFVVAYQYVSPAPPDSIRMGAGREGGAYAAFAAGYREVLAESGIEVVIVPSTGSVHNLDRLLSGDLDVALVQASVAGQAHRQGLESLGSLFHEPLWIFTPADLGLGLVSELRGLRVELGPPGSGTRALAERVLRQNGIGASDAEWLGSESEAAADSLESGGVEAMFAVGSVDSPLIRGLLESPDVDVVHMQRAEAYTRLDPGLSRVRLPRGAIDLNRDIPARDVDLVSTVAEFVITPDFHPALVDLLLQAARRVNGGGDVFTSPGHFPSPNWVDLPLSDDASRFFKYGPSFLQRYLPFWAATQIDRLKVMLIPLIALLLPLVRAFPPTYRWRVRSRIYRWYKELRLADPSEIEELDADEIATRLAEVERIAGEVAKVPAPPSYARELYALRLHIDFVARRLGAAAGESGKG